MRQTEKSAVVKHKLETEYNNDFSNTSILDRATGNMEGFIKEKL
jgi:hypothetical protein